MNVSLLKRTLALFGFLATNAFAVAPSITSTGPTALEVNQTYTYQVQATDPEGGDITYALGFYPDGMTIDQNGLVSWSAALDDAGNHTFKVIVTDNESLTAHEYVTLAVVDPNNNAPVFNGTAATATNINQLYQFDPQVTDIDGDDITLSVGSWPEAPGLNIDANGIVNWTPSTGQEGAYWVWVDANDGKFGITQYSYQLFVYDPTNNAPVILNKIGDTNVNVGQLFQYDLQASDADGDPLNYSLQIYPQVQGAAISSEGVFEWTPSIDSLDISHFVMVKADDGKLGEDEHSFKLTVVNTGNQSPTITSAVTTTVEVNTAYQYDVDATDPENDVLTYALVSAPAGMTIDTTTGVIDWLPTVAGDYLVDVSATDNINPAVSQSFTLTVTPPSNTAPVANDSTETTNEDTVLSFTLSANDAEADALSYTVLTQPTNGTLTGAAPNLTYTPNAHYFGTDTITFQVSDGEFNSNTASVTIVVNAMNDAPIAHAQSLTTNEDATLAITLSGTDEEGSALTYSIIAQPGNGALTGTAPNLTYTPNDNFFGSDVFTFIVNDGELVSAAGTININVSSVNDAPIAHAQSLTTNEDTALAITLSGTDEEGSALTYSIIAQPDNGELTGAAPNLIYTPNENYFGDDSFSFTVNDGQSDSGIVTVSITVDAMNDVPLMVSQPLTVATEGVLYSYAPEVMDSDSASFTFTLNASSTSATIDAASGEISWVPTADEIGAHEFILEVSDGSNSVSQNWNVVVIGDPVSLGASYLGTEFWIAFNMNYKKDGPFPIPVESEDRNHWLTISAPAGASGVVSVPGLSFEQSFDIDAGELIRIDLPDQVMNHDNFVIENKGVHVVSDTAIGVVATNYASATTDSMLAYPVTMIGTYYTIADMYRSAQRGRGGQFSILAIEDETIVKIVPKYGEPIWFDGDPQYDTFDIALGRGDVFHAQGNSSSFTGATIDANKPVTLTAGVSHANVPIGVSYADHLTEQLLPNNKLGSQYIGLPHHTRTGGEFYKFVAINNGTKIWVNDNLIAQLDAGEYYEEIIEGPINIRANKRIHALQASTGSEYDNAEFGDPFLVALPPLGAFANEYYFATPEPTDANLPTHYISIAIHEDGLNSLAIDGAAIDTSGYISIPGTEYYFGSQSVSFGAHHVESTSPFAMIFYGFGVDHSYGTLAGLQIGDASKVAAINFEAPSGTAVVGDEYCFDIQLLDAQSEIVSFIGFEYHISENKAGVLYTDALGTSELCDIQYQPGVTTTVEINVNSVSSSHMVQWNAPTDGVDRAPGFASLPDLNILTEEFVYQVEAYDPNGGSLSYRLDISPEGMTISSFGEIRWTPIIPEDRAPSRYEVIVTVIDSAGSEAQQSFYLTFISPPEMTKPLESERFESPHLYDSIIEIYGGKFENIDFEILSAPQEMEITVGPPTGEYVTNMPEVEGLVRYGIEAESLSAEYPQSTNYANPLCRTSDPDFSSVVPIENWTLDLGTRYTLVTSPISDTNFDGDVNDDDQIYAFAFSSGEIHIVDLSNGSLVDTISTENSVDITADPAVFDIDNDNQLEIIYLESSRSVSILKAIEIDGSEIWRSGNITAQPGSTSIIVKDIDQDGFAEIQYGPEIYDAFGNYMWSFESADRGVAHVESYTAIADLDNDGLDELMYHDQVRDVTGALLWSFSENANIAEHRGAFAVANLDSDPEKEVVASLYNPDDNTYSLGIWEHDGTEAISRIALASHGVPVVGDFNHDGTPDIYHPGDRVIITLDGFIIPVATQPSADAPDVVRTMLVDLNNDGAYELFESYQEHFQIRDLLSGVVLSTFETSDSIEPLRGEYSSTISIVDANHDGAGEIIVIGTDGIASLQSGTDAWRLPNRSYAQRFDITSSERNTNIDMQGVPSSALLADLWVGELNLRAQANQFIVSSEIVNRGGATITDQFNVVLYNQDKSSGGVEIGRSAPVDLLYPSQAMTLDIATLTEAQLTGEFFAYIEFIDTTPGQCFTENDFVSAFPVYLRVFDDQSGYRSDTYAYMLKNDEERISPRLNQRPIATVTAGTTYTFVPDVNDGSVGDDVLFSLSPLNSAPSVNSEGGPTFNPATGIISWVPSINHVGSNQWLYIIKDMGGNSYSYTASITVTLPEGSAPEITSIPATSTKSDRLYTYSIQAVDAENDPIIYELIDAPAGATLSASGELTWTPSTEGSVDFTARVSDGIFYSEQSWAVNVVANVSLDASISLSSTALTLGESITITADVEHAVGDVTTRLYVNSVEHILDETLAVTITPSILGVHDVLLEVQDASETMTRTAIFYVGDGSDLTAPIVELHTPLDGSEITSPSPIQVSVSDTNMSHWSVSISPLNGTFEKVLAEGSSDVVAMDVAMFDPSMFINGQYHIQVMATDLSGNTSQDSVTVTVDGDLKVGNFSFTVEDLNIPLEGIPIQVNRTYDSRRSAELLDFGYGWSIDYQNIKLEENRAPGTGWYIEDIFAIPPIFCVKPLADNIVTITLPNGDVEKFSAVANPECAESSPSLDVALQFVAIGDTQSTLTAVENQFGRLINGNLEDPGNVGVTLDPDLYQLTTRNGYVYQIDQNAGVTHITDPNGHTITYSESGIYHSNGKSISFVRNSLGLIDEIVDAKGNRIDYTRDANLDLTHVTQRDSSITEYTYNNTHGLVDIIDPLNRRVLRNVYDNDGRLTSQCDQNNVCKTFDHDLDARSSIVTDLDGRSTIFNYDERGNVLQDIKVITDGNYASDIVTTYTYDVNDNQETKTIAGSTWATLHNANNDVESACNPLNECVTYTNYNSRGQEGSITDERGHTYGMTYDSVGNLETVISPEVTDPDSGAVSQPFASNVMNTVGQVTSTTDLRGVTTNYTYYASGHANEGQKHTESNAISGTTTYTYDANNNVATETRERTVNGSPVNETTTYQYDTRDRLIRTTRHDGTYTETEYDLAGNTDRERDRFGNWTDYTYDAYGRLTRTDYADGSFETRTYTREGLLDTVTARNGTITRNEYDSAGRLWRVHNDTDLTFTETRYNEHGWVLAEYDALGNLTEYEYDPAGRREAVVRHIDGTTQRHAFTYYPNGELQSETDANGRTTTYLLNELDQRIEVQYHNATTMQERFDFMGTRTHSIDQESRSTHYAYDDLGRLTSVTPQVSIDGNPVPDTVYTYDEVGNRLTQTDAEHKTTVWTYDLYGRVLTRTLPEGQQESFVYNDGQGCAQTDGINCANATSPRTVVHTDFNGDTITTAYDVMGRTIAVQYSKDGNSDIYTYTANGQVHTVTDQHGTTTYTYDNNNRLLTEIKTDGTQMRYEYDAVGNRTLVEITRGGSITSSTTYTYDDLNRLENVMDSSGTTSYTYDNVGNLDTVTYPNGLLTDYDYNAVNQLTDVVTRDAINTVINHFSYSLTLTGRREIITELDGRTTAYCYDNLYRLTDEVVFEATPATPPLTGCITDTAGADYVANYEYDWVGNREYETVDGVQTAYTYDLNDRLIQTGGTVYMYDDNGNTLTETLDGVVKTYIWDAKNKLINFDNAGSITSYTYNHNGIRDSKTELGVTTQFIVDENRDYAQVLEEVESGSTTVAYTYGHDLLSQERGVDTSWFHYDGLGSTRLLSDGLGAFTDTYDYEAFGEVLNETGSTENSYKYTGEQYDASLEQIYLRARYYDGSIGRFTQQDTWAGVNSQPITLNKYLYANADPANMVDPSGNFSMGSVMSGINVLGRLATTALNTYSNITLLMDIAEGDVTLTELALTYTIGRFLPRSFFRCRNSFSSDTLVKTEFGHVPISEISIGDKVWSYNESSGEISLQEVIHLIEGEGSKELIDIDLDSGEVITTTRDHTFLTPEDSAWVEAGDLYSGVKLYGLDETYKEVRSLSPYITNIKVYNLSVANDHNYFVGKTEILAHNCYQKPNWHVYQNGKHIASRRLSQKQVRQGTQNGPAKYYLTSAREVKDLELKAWKEGVPVRSNPNFKVVEHPDVIGAKFGRDSRWQRLEYDETSDSIHGHPITKEEFQRYLRSN
ncbi:MAG: tandem-95 repeat protein [Agarilytica sp.]